MSVTSFLTTVTVAAGSVVVGSFDLTALFVVKAESRPISFPRQSSTTFSMTLLDAMNRYSGVKGLPRNRG